VRAVLSAACDVLVDLGARLVAVEFPTLAEASTAWAHICLSEAAIAHETTFPSRAAEYGPGLASVLAAGGKVSAAELGKAHMQRDRFAGQLAEVFRDIDVLLIPVLNTATPTAAEWDEMAKGDLASMLRFTAPFDLTGMPALTMNGGFDERGAPVGFQLVGKHLSEDLLLRAGHAFQSVTDWHTRHPALG
jgi:amidase